MVLAKSPHAETQYIFTCQMRCAELRGERAHEQYKGGQTELFNNVRAPCPVQLIASSESREDLSIRGARTTNMMSQFRNGGQTSGVVFVQQKNFKEWVAESS